MSSAKVSVYMQWAHWMTNERDAVRLMTDDRLQELSFLAQKQRQQIQAFVQETKRRHAERPIFRLGEEGAVETHRVMDLKDEIPAPAVPSDEEMSSDDLESCDSDDSLAERIRQDPPKAMDTFDTIMESNEEDQHLLQELSPAEQTASPKNIGQMRSRPTSSSHELSSRMPDSDKSCQSPHMQSLEKSSPFIEATAEKEKVELRSDVVPTRIENEDASAGDGHVFFATLPQRDPIPVKRTSSFRLSQAPPKKWAQTTEESAQRDTENPASKRIEADVKSLEVEDQWKASFSTSSQRIHKALDSLRASQPAPRASESSWKEIHPSTASQQHAEDTAASDQAEHAMEIDQQNDDEDTIKIAIQPSNSVNQETDDDWVPRIIPLAHSVSGSPSPKTSVSIPSKSPLKAVCESSQPKLETTKQDLAWFPVSLLQKENNEHDKRHGDEAMPDTPAQGEADPLSPDTALSIVKTQTADAFSRAKAMFFNNFSTPTPATKRDMQSGSPTAAAGTSIPSATAPSIYPKLDQDEAMEEKWNEKEGKAENPPAQMDGKSAPQRVSVNIDTIRKSKDSKRESKEMEGTVEGGAFRHLTKTAGSKDAFKAKNAPVAIHFATASQRERVEQRKAVQPLATTRPGMSADEDASSTDVSRSTSVRSSLQSTTGLYKSTTQSHHIKSLAAATSAKRKEELERERKNAHRLEVDRKREAARRREEERTKCAEERRKNAASESPRKRAADAAKFGNRKVPPRFVQKAAGPAKDPLAETAANLVKSAAVVRSGEDGKGKKHAIPSHVLPDAKKAKISEDPVGVASHSEARTSLMKTGAPAKMAIPQAVPHVDVVKYSTEIIKFASTDTKASQAVQCSKPIQAGHSGHAAADNIELPEIPSDEDTDESSDDEAQARKDAHPLPTWAESPELRQLLRRQANIDPDAVFGPVKPLQMDEIFRHKGERALARFRPRSSSANWSGNDKLTAQEIANYAAIMGYKNVSG